MSSRPATVAGGGAAPLLCGLPDEIIVWEILVRLPPKALLRCLAVSRSWRRAASTRDFLLAHHRRQPSLPLVSLYKHGGTWNDIRAFDHRPDADAQFQLLARLDGSTVHVHASCDGLLLLWVSTYRQPQRSRHLICNPVTRQIAGLPHTQLHGFIVMGLYPHGNAGEYRLLLRWSMRSTGIPAVDGACYVASLGGYLPHPRRIGCLPDLATFFSTPVAVDIWAMQDYETEVWLHKYRVELPLAEIRGKFSAGCDCSSVMVGYVDGRMVVLIDTDRLMLNVDVEGKLLASSRYDGHSLFASRYCLKQSLVLHTFFSTVQGAENAWPFM